MLESNAGLSSFLKDRSPDGWLRAPAQLCSTAAGCLLPQASSRNNLVNFVLLFPQHGEKSLAADLFLKQLLAFLHHIGHDICKIPPERQLSKAKSSTTEGGMAPKGSLQSSVSPGQRNSQRNKAGKPFLGWRATAGSLIHAPQMN